MAELSPDLQLIAERELGETQQVKKEAVARLRTLLAEEPDLNCQTDEEFLVKFLRSRKYRVQDTFKIIRNYYQARTEYKEMFEDLLPSRIKFDEVLRKNKLVTILKECDPHGRRIIIFKFGAWNPSICTLDEFFRASIVTVEYFLLEERFQIAGVVVVVDEDELSLAHFRSYTPFVIRKFIKLVQDCYPVRIRGIYIINHPPIFEVFYNIAKIFMNRKLVKRVRFIGRRYEELHKLIPAKQLPENYGGSMSSYDYDGFEKELQSKQEFFTQLSQYGYKK
ncbi:alpha-tocopherol transfer protein-like [Ixodes scapularis]|uniref:alpha-tocopherol transfer protein-like n=1 Tax=Ixodes scapularis TaxID=6945 RepID=UPI001A9EAB68|nr:alpha-tocopherol transfer protein-like [Ixodes scapularis]